MKIELITPKSNSLEDLQDYIAALSSVVRDKQPKSAEKLFNRLLKESVGNRASRVLEYIPCVIGRDVVNTNVHQYFGFWLGTKYYTNVRELLNWGMSLDNVLKMVDFTHYKVFKCETAYYVYGQISTHTQLTTVSHSQRYAECDRDYWMPPEVNETWLAECDPDCIEPTPKEWWNNIINNYSPLQLKELMKNCDITRKEIFDRGADMLQNRVFTIGGYTNNPNAWQHFLRQRMDKHTQLETQEFANMLHAEIDT